MQEKPRLTFRRNNNNLTSAHYCGLDVVEDRVLERSHPLNQVWKMRPHRKCLGREDFTLTHGLALIVKALDLFPLLSVILITQNSRLIISMHVYDIL